MAIMVESLRGVFGLWLLLMFVTPDMDNMSEGQIVVFIVKYLKDILEIRGESI